MKRLILSLFLIALILSPHENLTAQSSKAEGGYAIVIFKYNKAVNVWERHAPDGEYHVAFRGELYRTFPTGPKLVHGDERIPEGIHTGYIREDGGVYFYLLSTLGQYEKYSLVGPSLDRNVVPMHADAFESVRRAALQTLDAGFSTIPVVILPGTLEKEVADRIRSAKNVREGQTLEDVQESCRRWKHVEAYMIRSGRIPMLRFRDGEIIIDEKDAEEPVLPEIDTSRRTLADQT